MPDRSAGARGLIAFTQVAPANGATGSSLAETARATRRLRKYPAWIARQPALMAALHELRGKHLVCAPALSRRRAHRTRKPLKFGSRSALHAGAARYSTRFVCSLPAASERS